MRPPTRDKKVQHSAIDLRLMDRVRLARESGAHTRMELLELIAAAKLVMPHMFDSILHFTELCVEHRQIRDAQLHVHPSLRKEMCDEAYAHAYETAVPRAQWCSLGDVDDALRADTRTLRDGSGYAERRVAFLDEFAARMRRVCFNAMRACSPSSAEYACAHMLVSGRDGSDFLYDGRPLVIDHFLLCIERDHYNPHIRLCASSRRYAQLFVAEMSAHPFSVVLTRSTLSSGTRFLQPERTLERLKSWVECYDDATESCRGIWEGLETQLRLLFEFATLVYTRWNCAKGYRSKSDMVKVCRQYFLDGYREVNAHRRADGTRMQRLGALEAVPSRLQQLRSAPFHGEDRMWQAQCVSALVGELDAGEREAFLRYVQCDGCGRDTTQLQQEVSVYAISLDDARRALHRVGGGLSVQFPPRGGSARSTRLLRMRGVERI